MATKKNLGDACVLTQAEWMDRNEEYGHGAAATMVIDGSVLYQSFNFGEPPEEAEELTAIAEALGYFIEMGFAWSLHFYPVEQ